jgi:hypothetical protein
MRLRVKTDRRKLPPHTIKEDTGRKRDARKKKSQKKKPKKGRKKKMQKIKVKGRFFLFINMISHSCFVLHLVTSCMALAR